MRPDPSHEEYMRQWVSLYEATNYDQGLAGYFLSRSHAWLENAFAPDREFPRVLEVGAGTGIHLRHVRHRFREYVLTDGSADMLRQVQLPADRAGSVQLRVADACHLEFEDDGFDRLIATHVLEHLERPWEVLREWHRVVKPGGVISLILPRDPGLGWRLGRQLVARGKFVKAGMEYDYWMAREHINPINNLVALLRYYFPERQESWAPLRIPSMDLNLFYLAHLKVQK